jgi:hypothetical protein
MKYDQIGAGNVQDEVDLGYRLVVAMHRSTQDGISRLRAKR